MAITQTPLTGAIDSTNATSYVTASIAPSANKLVLVVITNLSAGADNPPTGLTGAGMTWVQVATVLNAAYYNRCTIYRALSASPGSGALTITFGETQYACGWSVFELGNVDTAGTNGSAAVVQAVTATGNASPGLVTLAAFGSADNATVGGFATRNTSAHLPGSGFTEIHDLYAATETLGLETEWRADNDTTVDITDGGTMRWAGIGLEIKAAAAAVGHGRALLLGVG